jgi:hypothetical protein
LQEFCVVGIDLLRFGYPITERFKKWRRAKLRDIGEDNGIRVGGSESKRTLSGVGGTASEKVMQRDDCNRNQGDDKYQTDPKTSIHAQFILTQLNRNCKVESLTQRIASDWAWSGRELGDSEAVRGVFHSCRGKAPAKGCRFSRIRVDPEGTEASFSTVLAFGVLEILGSLLALS